MTIFVILLFSVSFLSASVRFAIHKKRVLTVRAGSAKI